MLWLKLKSKVSLCNFSIVSSLRLKQSCFSLSPIWARHECLEFSALCRHFRCPLIHVNRSVVSTCRTSWSVSLQMHPRWVNYFLQNFQLLPYLSREWWSYSLLTRCTITRGDTSINQSRSSLRFMFVLLPQYLYVARHQKKNKILWYIIFFLAWVTFVEIVWLKRRPLVSFWII